jgi:adenine-specific DNA-methyltransferase
LNKLNGNSTNIIEDNIKKLKEIFPEIFSENKIDFDKFKQEMGEFIDDKSERYNFTWNGKAECKKLALTPSTGTLRPCKEESKNFDITQNLYIEGDNLEVLKLFQKSYHKKIKMIYIDPPYNTGKDFVYKDNFKDNIRNYLETTGQINNEGNRLSTNSDTSGRYHSDWLNMMYPRLKLSRNLLKDDGVIFISIDDNEVSNLRKLCDEIFGEDNFVASVIWNRKRGRDNSAKWFSKSHEYLLVYAKNKMNFTTNFLELDENTKKAYKNPDNDVRGIYRMLAVWARGTQSGVKYDFTSKDGTYFAERLWLFSKKNLEKLDIENKLIFKGDNIYRKLFLFENKGKIPETIWNDTSNAANAADEIKQLFGKIIFDTPKPIPYIMEILKIGTNENDIILDFYSGSATTADSIIKLNSEDNGNRKFILVQLPEKIDFKSESYKEGYINICEIGKERIRRAGEKILEENKDKDLSNLDIGFKVLKLDSSNIKTWDSEYENLEQNLLDSIDNIKSDRTNEDLLYEILLKYGLDLTLPIEELNINGKKVFNIGFGALIVCLDSDIDTNTVEQIAQLKKQYEEDYGLDKMRIVFKDNGFKNAVVKTNALQILKQHNINEVVSI